MVAERERTFLRPKDGNVLGGVMAAVARQFGVDATLLRCGSVLAMMATGGALLFALAVSPLLVIGICVLIYLACWVLIPAE